MLSSHAVSRYMLVATGPSRRSASERAVVRRLRLVRVAAGEPVPARPRTFEHIKRIYD
jgi:hypothetical protein